MAPRSDSRHRSTQARGDERRARILAAALDLLNTRDVSEITYSDIGRKAQIPLGSMHFFFADLQAIYQAILDADYQAIADRITRPLTRQQTRSWRTLYFALLDRGIKYMRENVGVGQLVIGGKTALALRRRNHKLHGRMAMLLEQTIDKHIALPQIPRRTEIFFVAVEIFDLILTLSMIEHRSLASYMAGEAKKASAAYLALYFEENLPPRDASPAGPRPD